MTGKFNDYVSNVKIEPVVINNFEKTQHDKGTETALKQLIALYMIAAMPLVLKDLGITAINGKFL